MPALEQSLCSPIYSSPFLSVRSIFFLSFEPDEIHYTPPRKLALFAYVYKGRDGPVCHSVSRILCTVADFPTVSDTNRVLKNLAKSGFILKHVLS